MTATGSSTVLRLPLLQRAGLRHGFTTRAAGDFAWDRLRTESGRAALVALGEEVGFDPLKVVTCEQVHGTAVAVAHLCERCGPGNRVPHTDGLITEEPWALLTVHADCYPVVLFVPAAPMVAVVHAGWRGTVGGIVPRAVARLVRESGAGPSSILAGIGPGICGGCYQVGAEVAAAAQDAGLTDHVRPDPEAQRWRFDIASALRQQLREAGIPAGSIETIEACTFEDAGLFSFRRDHGPERGAAVVVLDGGRVLAGGAQAHLD